MRIGSLSADLEAAVRSQSLPFVQTLSTLVKILKINKLKFRRDFEAEVFAIFVIGSNYVNCVL